MLPRYSTLFAILSLQIVTLANALAARPTDLYRNTKHGYQLSVPPGWHLSESSNIPVIFNYPRHLALPQGLIRDGGAEIYLVPFSAVYPTVTGSTLADWIEQNNNNGNRNVKTEHVTPLSTSRSYPQQVIRGESDYVRSPDDAPDDLQ